MKKIIFSFVIFIVCMTVLWAIEQTVGSLHFHSTFSDGTERPSVLITLIKKMKFDFFVVDDHREQIDKIFKGSKSTSPDFGFDNYFKTFNIEKDIVGIAGVEEMAGGHLLVFGEEDKTRKFCESTLPKKMSEIVDLANYYGLISIAAHPNQKNYPFQKASKVISGIEFFNENDSQYLLTRQWYFDLLKDGKNIFVSAGSDHHSLADFDDIARWNRKTILICPKTRKDILQAFRSGKTYATTTNCDLDKMNFWPAFNYQKAEIAQLKFDLVFAKKTVENLFVNIYTDGKLAKTITLKKGQLRYPIEYNDKNSGKHWYVIEMKKGKEFVLITSPIRLDIKQANLIFEPKNKGLQDLIGKSRQEIEKIFGTKEQQTYQNTYTYDFYPSYSYRTRVNFAPYLSKYDHYAPQPIVHAYSVSFVDRREQPTNGRSLAFDPKPCLSPDKILPPNLLKTKPSGVFPATGDNAVVAIWYLKGKTYMLRFCDRSSRPLYATKIVKRVSRRYANKNTSDFRHGCVLYFAAVDKIVKPTSGYTVYECNFALYLDPTNGDCCSFQKFD